MWVYNETRCKRTKYSIQKILKIEKNIINNIKQRIKKEMNINECEKKIKYLKKLEKPYNKEK